MSKPQRGFFGEELPSIVSTKYGTTKYGTAYEGPSLLPDDMIWGFGPEDSYEVGDTFEWGLDCGDVYCSTKASMPFGTYKITGKSEDPFGRNWYAAVLLPENPMSEEDMREIST